MQIKVYEKVFSENKRSGEVGSWIQWKREMKIDFLGNESN